MSSSYAMSLDIEQEEMKQINNKRLNWLIVFMAFSFKMNNICIKLKSLMILC